MSIANSPSKPELLNALHVSGDRVLTTLRALPAAAFEPVRYDGGWTGHQILAHLASIEWTYPRLIDRAKQAAARSGDNHADESRRAPHSVRADDGIDAYNERQVTQRAHTSIDVLLEEFARNRAATITAFEAVDDELLAVSIRSAGKAHGPLGGVIYRVAIEHVLGHLRDIVGNEG